MTDQSITRVIAHKSVMSRRLDDELVLYHPLTDAVMHLDPIATHVWNELLQEVTVDDLVATLAFRFDADAATVAADVRALVTELVDAQLVRSIR